MGWVALPAAALLVLFAFSVGGCPAGPVLATLPLGDMSRCRNQFVCQMLEYDGIAQFFLVMVGRMRVSNGNLPLRR